VYTEAFAAFIEEMGLHMYVCRKADPETKGKVESTIKYVKRNFLKIRDFECIIRSKTAAIPLESCHPFRAKVATVPVESCHFLGIARNL
ncbi:MAG: hypothetical protein QF732_08535, partial [Nitrospinaceae bacterium]|nr:hypothetical protein [Nitrospinaceae bacterium]